MNNALDPLALPLTPAFSRNKFTNEYDSRGLFYRLVHVGEQPKVLSSAYVFIQQHLAAVKHYPHVDFSTTYQPDALNNAFKTTISLGSETFPLQPGHESLPLIAPVLLTKTASLSNIVQACTNQSPFAIELFAVLLALTRGVQTSAFVKAQTLNAGVELPALHTWAFAQQPNIPDCLFEFGALQLALGQFPRVFFPEILGFCFAYCQGDGLLELINANQQAEAAGSLNLWDKTQHLHAQRPRLLKIMQAYLAAFAVQQDALWLRIQTGYWLYFQQTEHCFYHLQVYLNTPLSPQQALLKLLQRIMPHAIGHHGNIQLADKSLDAWFKTSPFDGEGFLNALKQSVYIDRCNPAASRLLKLFDFNGPMFGVLNEAEKNLLKTWVCAEPMATPGATLAIAPTLAQDSLADALASDLTELPLECPDSPAVNYAKFNNREWFYTLVNIDLYPAALDFVKQNVNKVLRQTRLFNRLPFKQYTHQVFNDYIHALYQQEVKRYQPLQGTPRISKNTYRWGIEQLAPAILTDGCWLQNINQLNYHPTYAIGALLFSIYSDELGGGLLAQNHPAIYQKLLDSIGLHLPPIHSQAFSQHQGFINSAFDIPCYLMAISKFPCAFLPELLGLNMAIELSGLGKDYLRLAQALSFYGIDASIVNVHISIDNVATGHAALAIQAIQRYLDEILSCSGERIMQEHWHRIYTGYCSLATASKVFKFSLVGQVFCKRLAKTFSSAFKINPHAPAA